MRWGCRVRLSPGGSRWTAQAPSNGGTRLCPVGSTSQKTKRRVREGQRQYPSDRVGGPARIKPLPGMSTCPSDHQYQGPPLWGFLIWFGTPAPAGSAEGSSALAQPGPQSLGCLYCPLAATLARAASTRPSIITSRLSGPNLGFCKQVHQIVN